MGMDADPDEEPEEIPAEGPDAPQELPPPKDAPDRQQVKTSDDPRTPGQTRADWLQQTESGWDPKRKFEVPRKELAEFDLKRAGLPEMTFEEADRYVEEHRDARPWLSMTDKASPEARRIIAALDAAGGHAHIRHEGWVTEEANERRAAYLEDPAQLDPEKRHRSVDGLRADEPRHRCADMSTRITDPDAFATAFARGVEHVKVREALGMQYETGDQPGEVKLPIADLLGPKGHLFCTGWQLEADGVSIQKAQENRALWVKARAGGPATDAAEPSVQPVSTFEGGQITFAFTSNETERRYETVTMFSRPPDQNL